MTAENRTEDAMLTDLYFGSRVVHFAKVAGKSFRVRYGDLFLEKPDSRAKTGTGIELPYIPADVVVPRAAVGETIPNSLLSVPLLKTEWITNIIGTRSGTRSGIIHDGNKHYRLKGCGNQNKMGIQNGFVVQEILPGKIGLEIRGSSFEDLCYREVLKIFF